MIDPPADENEQAAAERLRAQLDGTDNESSADDSALQTALFLRHGHTAELDRATQGRVMQRVLGDERRSWWPMLSGVALTGAAAVVAIVWFSTRTEPSNGARASGEGVVVDVGDALRKAQALAVNEPNERNARAWELAARKYRSQRWGQR